MKASKVVIATAVLTAALANAQTIQKPNSSDSFQRTAQPGGAKPGGMPESGSMSRRSDITKETTVTRQSGNRSTGNAPLPPADASNLPNGVMPGGASNGSMGIRAGMVEPRYPGSWQSLSA
jgi:hypothetical protein